ncbi:hypothetical protein IJ182_05505 [bacterium]|nr:hypothetical protein [bacterium]
MKKAHAIQRAEQRYYIEDFNPIKALRDILDDKCIQIEANQEKYSQIFLIRYINKYVKVVTDFNVSFVKTVLPLEKIEDFDRVNDLINKLSVNEAAA